MDIFAYGRAYRMTMITFDTECLKYAAFPPLHAAAHMGFGMCL